MQMAKPARVEAAVEPTPQVPRHQPRHPLTIDHPAVGYHRDFDGSRRLR
jgi:hypothetical protein